MTDVRRQLQQTRKELQAEIKAQGGPRQPPTGAEHLLRLIELVLRSPDRLAVEVAYSLGRMDGDGKMMRDPEWNRGRKVVSDAARGGQTRSLHDRNLKWLAELKEWRTSHPHLHADTRFVEMVAKREGRTPRAVRSALNKARLAGRR